MPQKHHTRSSCAQKLPAQNPTIALTAGDPAGIGPEIVCKTLKKLPLEIRKNVVVFGPPDVLRRANGIARSNWIFKRWNPQRKEHSIAENEVLLSPCCVQEKDDVVRPGAAAAGTAAYLAIRNATREALAKRVDALVTAPIHKASLQAAGYDFRGHTDLLAHLTNTHTTPVMTLITPGFSVAHITAHVSLRRAIEITDAKRCITTTRIACAHWEELHGRPPRVALSGLNPHCGEGGLFGDEEQIHLQPAVRQLRLEGISIEGPIAPDVVFRQAAMRKYDLVIAPYHDQGHIAVKMIAFDQAVHATLGLRIKRTSPVHGTAFDIAGTGKAEPRSMIAALLYARRWASRNPVEKTKRSQPPDTSSSSS